MSLVQSATGLIIIIIIITTIIMSLCLYSDKRDLEGFFYFTCELVELHRYHFDSHTRALVLNWSMSGWRTLHE